jgi:transcriptional regulator with XRE-family HTH domain
MRTSLGRTLSSIRKLRGLTQAELAERLSVSQPIIARWENGKARPNEGSLTRIAEALGTTVEALLSGDQDPYGPQPRVLEDAELVELFSQAHRLEGRDREALKAVLEAMLTRSRVQEALQGKRGA